MPLTGPARAVLTGLAALAVLGAASPAEAHPLGDPQTVRLSADGHQVTALWTAAADDLLVLGSLTGAIPERREYVFDLDPDAEPAPVGETDAELLSSSPDVADYLAEHITVRQDGRQCPAEVDLAGLVGDGAELTFTCPEPVADVEIEVTTLTDADSAYRTVAFAEAADPEQHLFNAGDPRRDWNFSATRTGQRSWLTPAALAAGLVLAAATAVAALRRLNRTARAAR
ncbi:hypothetical protein GCM10029992_24130 [Glycomyces albus]